MSSVVRSSNDSKDRGKLGHRNTGNPPGSHGSSNESTETVIGDMWSFPGGQVMKLETLDFIGKISFISSQYNSKQSGQISIIPKPELRGFWGNSLTKPPFKVTSAEVVIICPEAINRFWETWGRGVSRNYWVSADNTKLTSPLKTISQLPSPKDLLGWEQFWWEFW